MRQTLKIKRVVLLYDEDLEADEIDDYSTQYSGVQLLRGQQWIETLDVQEFIPIERPAGFRGFAEFEKHLERALREAENPQHEGFEGRNPAVKKVRDAVKNAVRQFALKKGWLNEAQTQDAPERVQEVATEFLDVFAGGAGNTRRGRGTGSKEPDEPLLHWKCELILDFPTANSSRVNYGQSITDVGVDVECEPLQSTRYVDISLEVCHVDEKNPIVVAQREGVAVSAGGKLFALGNFQVVEGHAGNGMIQLPQLGEWNLRAKIWHRGEMVKSAMRRLYVDSEPPAPPQPKPYTISVSVTNTSRQGQSRINNGDEISIQVTATSRATDDATLRVDFSLEDLLLADNWEVELAGVPIGDVPNRKPSFPSACLYTLLLN